MSRALALDQSLKTTGWAVFENESLVEYGHFTVPAMKTIGDRLEEFWYRLGQLKTEHDFDILYFEDIQNQNNNETYKKLAYVQAVIFVWCQFNKIECVVLSPSHWRNLIKEKYGLSFGRKREEQKRASKKLVKDKYRIEAIEDEADAICIGLAGLIESGKTASAF